MGKLGETKEFQVFSISRSLTVPFSSHLEGPTSKTISPSRSLLQIVSQARVIENTLFVTGVVGVLWCYSFMDKEKIYRTSFYETNIFSFLGARILLKAD
ncbi:MAG: hypothetical protein OK439_01680 [Thaumarchaeota archaeon]|nr:hypothetical protein [Nitrososphaerota archaeon]